jgi:hypothetical protein
MEKIVEQVVKDFCLEFIKTPYLCYTEHGQHALFFNRLYMKIPEEQRYFQWHGNNICVIQKEYPTATDLDKSQRQHWDISVIAVPPKTLSDKNSYDFFRLNSVVEFGLNASERHLVEDIRRLTHPDSNIVNKFAVHLYRFSENITRKDWSIKSSQIIYPGDVKGFIGSSDVTVYYGVADLTNNLESGLWKITKYETIKESN